MQDPISESSIKFINQNPQREILRGFVALLPVGFLSLLGILLGEWMKHNYILEPRQHFLIETAILFLDAFVLNYAVHWFLTKKSTRVEDKRNKLLASIIDPLVSLPKVFLSYFLLLVCTQASLNFFEASPFPILFLLVFFIWAPYIVGYEFFAKPMTENDEIEDFDPFDDMPQLPPQKLFMGKAGWRIGFNRSIDFATRNLSLSVALVFAIWIGRVLPELLSLFIADPLVHFRAIFVQKILEWTCDMYIHSYIVWVLFSRLEPEEKQELEVELKELPAKVSLTYAPPFGLRVSVLAVLVLSVTLLWSERKVQLGGIPNAEAIKIKDVTLSEREIVFKLSVKDEVSKLRWFRPERLRLLENPTDRAELDKMPRLGPLSDNKKDISERSIEMLLLKREELIEASRYKVTNSKGEVIESYQLSPRDDELEVLLAFPIKKRSNTALSALYELSYLSILGFKDPIYTFSDAKK